MRRLWVALIGCMIALPGWTQTSSLSDCLLGNRVQSVACTSQIVRLESQYAYVPQLARNAGIDPALILATYNAGPSAVIRHKTMVGTGVACCSRASAIEPVWDEMA